MISLHQLTKRFGDRLAVDHLDLHVASGSIVGLLGHNGAGKSTTIGMLLGQVWPTAGEPEVTRDRSQALARIGAIFEAPAFYEYLSGWRNLEILSAYTAHTPERRLREVLAWVGLEGREGGAVRTYSHGMRARLALAQALLPNPELLILDEPTNGLDPEGIHEMRATIRRLHTELGLTILLSSHLLGEVEQLCTRIAVLNHGRKVFDGTLEEARESRRWIRLKTPDLPAAIQSLRQAGMVVDERPPDRVAPADAVTVRQIVQRLVEKGFPVDAISPEEPNLEEFYLSLMKQSGKYEGAAPSITGPQPKHHVPPPTAS
jgi:ABC-2 type transport system ATP-binding protein